MPSPYFTTKDIAQKEGQPRADDPAYRPFITFRLNDDAIVALDWPEQLDENDQYVESARSLFYSLITPAVAHVLEKWPRLLADAVGVPPLTEITSEHAAANERVQSTPSGSAITSDGPPSSI